MPALISIDNGGTLTDVVVVDGPAVHRVKTLTTPGDLSRCFFDGLRKASAAVYGTEDVGRLLAGCELIRYSTTEGTNALVQRRGPRLGLLVSGDFDTAALATEDSAADLLGHLVGDRVVALEAGPDETQLAAAIVPAVNALTAAGAGRIVVALSGEDYRAAEQRVRRLALRAFPSHLLGTVPLSLSHEVADDTDVARRTWTALLNAFLHPSMDRFLFHADQRLRRARVRTPLLVFRNDGGSARVAKTSALRTFSSGPRGGLEGVRALAAHYGLGDVLSIDVGGTTTDVGRLRGGDLRARRYGRVEGVETSLPLPALASLGVGGGSILRVRDGAVIVGPDSVGAAPGPACFGLGGEEATITDALLLAGLLDPATYFGGGLPLRREAAEHALASRIGEPLGLDVAAATAAAIDAWVGALAAATAGAETLDVGTVLMAFGGAGPMLVAPVAERLGLDRVLVPRAAAVFSAYGIAFSDVAHEYHAPLGGDDALEEVRAALMARATRDMLAEQVAIEDCAVDVHVLARGEEVRRLELDAAAEADTMVLRVAKPTRRPALDGLSADAAPARPAGTRTVRGEDLPLLRVEDLAPGAIAAGPAVLEEELFTALLPAGWELSVSALGDLWLQRRNG